MKITNRIIGKINVTSGRVDVSAAAKKRSCFSIQLLTAICIFLISNAASVQAQLATYAFSGLGNCPNQNPNVSSQPANAVFSPFNSWNVDCQITDNVYATKKWNKTNTIDLTEYNQFSITPNAVFGLNLTQIRFDHAVDQLPGSGNTTWILRSSIDNFSTDLATGVTNLTAQTSTVNLPAAFGNIGTVIFRFFLLNANGDATNWIVDNVKVYGTVITVPATPPNPTSNTPQCLNTGGVTLTFSAIPPAGETWYWQTSAYGTNTGNSLPAYSVTSSGTYYLRSRNNVTLNWSVGLSYTSVVVVNSVGTPVFANGAASIRCKGAGLVNYGAGAANSSSITYSLDAASLAAGNTINSATGAVTYTAGWEGSSVITANASGCGSNTSSSHTATTVRIMDQTVTAMPDTVCKNGNSNINLAATQTGVQYTLRDNADNTIIAGPVAGTGTSLNLNTGNMGNTSKTFNILAERTITSGALSFDGVDDYLSVPDAAALNPTAITVECWVKINAKTPYGVIMAKANPYAMYKGWGLVMDDKGEKITFYVNDYPNGYVESSTKPALGTWVHVAATFDGAQTKIYINGILENTTNYAGTIPATPNSLLMGSFLGNQLQLNGALDEVRIWNTARTQAQIQGTMNSSLSGTEPNLVAYYPFDEGAGSSVANDVAGSNNNGTLNNMDVNAAWITRSFISCNLQLSTTPKVTVRNDVGNVSFVLGNSSTRCIGAGTVNYTANATDNTGITYSLDAASLAAGNTVNATTGDVTFAAGWSGPTFVTASAAGCNGPKTQTHKVNITPTVGDPVFDLGATSTRCQKGETVDYKADATDKTSISFTLDAASLAAGNTINADTTDGKVTFTAGWSGTSVITVTVYGCNGPKSTTHTITTTPTVGTPVFALGATSTRCQGANTVNYGATATNSTGITYTLDNASRSAGNTINAATGDVTYVAGWVGTSTITASATGCNGPVTGTHTATSTPSVVTPAFTQGPISVRCQGAGTLTFTATAANSTGISYSLDASSLAAGNTINAATGEVTFVASWFGPATITATATGCNGPATATHICDTRDPVLTPVFASGSSTIRCKGGGTVNYSATATNALKITYSIDAASTSGGVSINASTGDVTYPNGWVGTTVITASASGCSGPTTATHSAATYDGVTTPVFALGNSSTICQASGTVNYTATSSYATSMTYSLDAASISGGNTINAATGDVTYAPGWSGSTTITASAAGCGGPKTKTHSVTITPSVGTPVFTTGSTSTRCQGANSVTYNATATTNTGITYSLDATSLAAGLTIAPDGSGGKVTYTAGWSGTTVITATATGCNGPKTSTHTVTTTPTVSPPVFPMGATSTRCQGGGSVSYAATAANSTSISYSIDGLSISGGNSINASTGLLSFAPGWVGNTTITAVANGCNGPMAAMHTVTSTATVGTPVFTMGASSTRCIGAGTVTYTANATGSTGITYSLDGASSSAGNTINAATGAVTYVAGWGGPTVITASAAGCNGPKTANHTVTITPTVGTPVFALGTASVRCQGSSFTTYSATATNSTSISYSLDAASIAGSVTINSSTGVVVFPAAWSGTTIVTASATGCNGPSTSSHTITITPTVGTPVFTAGASSVRCQGAGTITYAANATNTTGIKYKLDAASISGGNTIDSLTGTVTYVPGWSGTTTVTAAAAGCNGPSTASHSVTVTPTVGTPVFASGAQSVRDQGAATVTYSASATNNTGITYTLDQASLDGGNTINASTGAVTWNAGWYGVSSITATATGCNGPSQSSHIVNINTTIVQTPLYLSIPNQSLDRIDPVATNITTTEATGPITANSAGVVQDAMSTTSGTSATISLSHTTGTGSNRFMLVGISQPNRTVTSVIYGSTPLTLVGYNNNNGNARVAIYALVNPPSGTANVVVNFSSAPDRGAVVSVTTYSGVNQSSPLGSFVSDENKSSTPSVNVTAAAGDLIYDVVAVKQQTVAVGSGQTQKWNIYSGQDIYGAGSTKPGSASTNMSWTNSSSTDWAIGAVAIKPAPATNTTTFTQNPALCSDLVIKAQTIQMLVYVKVTSGTMPVNPNITATLKYDATNIISLNNPVYNSASGILSWTGNLGADVTVPAGKALALTFTTAQAGVEFQIEYHSNTKPSRISLLPVSTFIDFISFRVYDAPYPGGSIRVSGNINQTYYVRAVVTTPFGYTDITGLDININPPGNTVPVNCVDSSACTRTYELPWTTSASTGTYYLLGTAKEGHEQLIKNSDLVPFDVCTLCPPVALPDSATGAGGSPILVEVLANDYDPNNNLKLNTLAVSVQPNNGSAFISNNKVVYLPNGTYAGKDTLTYQICDSTGLCATAKVFLTINPLIVDPCSEATKTQTYYLPFSENEARMALDSSSSIGFPSNNIRTIISLKMPYPGMTIIWDEWEDGYEINPLNPLQSTTKIWGDGNPYNGVAPGYSNDIIPAGGSIVLDNTIPTNPRVSTNLFYDGRDKIIASGKIAVTQVCGEPSIIGVQCMKTNVSSTYDYGTSFTIPVGQNFNSQDFRYTALFIRANFDSTIVEIDKDNNGTLETRDTLNQGEIFLVNGGVLSGATVTSNKNIGVDVHFGGKDSYSSREVPIYPASWYNSTYYTPVPTTHSPDSNAVLLYNSLNRAISINWSSGIPSSGTVTLPAKTVVRFPLAVSATAAYKFLNPTGESFTAIQICDSYTPGGGGNDGATYDWAFNLISEQRLTDLATIAWAPGSTNGTRNDNPIWVTPNANTTIYVKYNGNIGGTGGLNSPCGFRYDVSYPLSALTHKRLLDLSDNDQSGLAVFTCDGTKIAAVYGEDASTATAANPSWDVGSTIQPFCKQKLIFANDDYGRTMVNQPVTIPILVNDFGFLAVVDPGTVVTAGLLQPKHGSVFINTNGTVIYTPDPGYVGKDTFEYRVCSTPSPVVCDNAYVYIDISVCPAPYYQNVISGQVFIDKNEDGANNDGGTGIAGLKVYLYADANCNAAIDANELKDSITVDVSGTYQFITYPEKFVADDFSTAANTASCASGSDGNTSWLTDWTDVDQKGSTTGYCTTGNESDIDVDVKWDNGFGYALRLKDNNRSATRSVNLSGASYAFLSFSYRRNSSQVSSTNGHNVIVQASKDGTNFGTVFTIAGDGNNDSAYVNIYNQDITSYTVGTSATYIRFLTNNLNEKDTVYVDNVKIQYLRYPQCYITRLDSTTIPAYHHKTTVLQHSFTATSSQTCLSPYDFGIAKNKITISGTLFQDANGLTDNLVNGTPIGTVSGTIVYAYLVDSTGKVVRRTILNNSNGTFSFTNADVFTNYQLRVSTTSVNVGDSPPLDAGLSTASGYWVNTGDTYGLNNMAGTGIKSGAPTGAIAVSTAAVNVTNVNVAVERLPDSDNRTIAYTLNTPNVQYDVTGGLTGSDPEDGVLGAGKTYKITSLPFGAVLYYNGAAVMVNQVITNFNPALLKIDPDDDTQNSFFTYASKDAAGLFDPTPATITVSWQFNTLPAEALVAEATLNGNFTMVKWSTLSEQNTDYFVVERSTDNMSFATTGFIVKAAGTSTTKKFYQQQDDISSITQSTVIYYRVRLYDIDGKSRYSNVVAVRLSAKPGVTVYPNPFHASVIIDITTESETMIDINFFDVGGNQIRKISRQATKGMNQIPVNNLDNLPGGMYLIEITDRKARITYQKLLKNN